MREVLKHLSQDKFRIKVASIQRQAIHFYFRFVELLTFYSMYKKYLSLGFEYLNIVLISMLVIQSPRYMYIRGHFFHG